MARLIRILAVLWLILPLDAFGQFTLLYEFTGGADGNQPSAGLTLSGSTLFGTGGGNSSNVFSIGTDGTGFNRLRYFAGGSDDGRYPYSDLTLSGSTLFGTTSNGGDGNQGTIYSMNTDGTGFKLLHEFAGQPYGSYLRSNLTLSGSTLFGTAYYYAFPDHGRIFSINTDGTGYTVLHEFAGGANDGSIPNANTAGLTVSGSTLFGTTWLGGDYDGGTIYSMNTDGTGFTLLHEFPLHYYWANGPYTRVSPNRLTLSGSTLFGATTSGGVYNTSEESLGGGTIFSMNTDGTGFQLLHEFAGGANDGKAPYGGMTLSGSTLIGTTLSINDYNKGTIFSINTDGTGFKQLHKFVGGVNDGRRPTSGVTLSGSTLFGTTENGGDSNLGTIFSLANALPVPGDYNDNGTVDAADYVVWRKGLGTTYTQSDYDIWRAHFGQSAGSGSGATGSASASPAVPEPTSLALLLIAAAGFLVTPRHRVVAKNRY